MNTSLSITRTYAQRCSLPAALLKQPFTQQQLPIRSISSTPSNFYAQPTEPIEPTGSPSPDTAPFSHLQPSLNQPQTNPKKNPSRLPQDQNQPTPSTLFIGTVSRTGTMPQTVQLTRQHQVYDPFLQKHYTRPLRIKAHDPNPPTYLREGDIVEYGVYTQAEKDAKVAKNLDRIAREEERLERVDKNGKAVRKFRRDEETKRVLKGRKTRGVQFVVRRVVTPFGVGLDERMEKLSEVPELEAQQAAVKGGQDNLVRNLGGNLRRQSGKVAVAG